MKSLSPELHVMDPETVRPDQIRAARALLNWSTEEAAKRCGVGRNTIGRLETETKRPGNRTMQDIVRAFNEHGIVFVVGDNGRGILMVDRA